MIDPTKPINRPVEIVELPLWYKGEVVSCALIDAKNLAYVSKLGKWNFNHSNGAIVGAPRHTEYVRDQTGRPYQINIALHRLVYALMICENDLQREHLVSIKGLADLWRAHQEFPRIKQVDGNYLNCTEINLDTSLAARTIERKTLKGIPLNVSRLRFTSTEGSVPEHLSIPKDDPTLQLPETEHQKLLLETERLEREFKAQAGELPKNSLEQLQYMGWEPKYLKPPSEEEKKAHEQAKATGEGAVNLVSKEDNAPPEVGENESPPLPK